MPPPNQQPAPDQPFLLPIDRQKSTTPRLEQIKLGSIHPSKCFGMPCSEKAGSGRMKILINPLWIILSKYTTPIMRPRGKKF